MDVDWNAVQGAIPVAFGDDMAYMSYVFQTYDSLAVQIVPVVFITNRTFERIDSTEIPLLAKRVIRRCLPAFDEMDVKLEDRYARYNNYKPISVKEVQIDCDWTVRTSSAYFRFLSEVKKLLASQDVTLTATIRLHQFKYPKKTGVPPADRGMLMIYNLSDPKQYSAANSIYDQEKAAAYFTSSKNYPLPLDMALPAWSWCLIFRNKKFYQIENGLTEKELKELSFVRKGKGPFYEVTKDTVYREIFFRPGDEIKLEKISPEDLRHAASLARKANNTDHFTVSLFELSEQEFNQFSHATIDEVYDSFR